MNAFLGILAIILMLGMIADWEKDNRFNFTVGFCITMIAMIVLNTK
ncbi:MAG: hypothetical protein PHY44_07755 [Lachnospiraceae bacterium]|nr:hypothetical protein [Lachnospiraceae bacterium]